jgi:hypothetical protein
MLNYFFLIFILYTTCCILDRLHRKLKGYSHEILMAFLRFYLIV